MDDFIATVRLEGDTKPTELLTFGKTPEEIVDNIVLMANVEFLYHIKRKKDGELWDFDAEIEPLREIRSLIEKTNGELGFSISFNEDNNENKLN